MQKLEKGAANQLLMTTDCRVCFRKFLAAQLPPSPQRDQGGSAILKTSVPKDARPRTSQHLPNILQRLTRSADHYVVGALGQVYEAQGAVEGHFVGDDQAA
jgi:hypothetical protein